VVEGVRVEGVVVLMARLTVVAPTIPDRVEVVLPRSGVRPPNPDVLREVRDSRAREDNNKFLMLFAYGVL